MSNPYLEKIFVGLHTLIRHLQLPKRETFIVATKKSHYKQ